MVQERMSMVEELEVFETEIAFGDARSIDIEGRNGRFGWRVCRFRVKQNTSEEHRLQGGGVDCL